MISKTPKPPNQISGRENMSRYISSANTTKSRKARACIWCGETIKKGEPAFVHTYIEDGIQNSYFHPECDSACRKYLYNSRRAGHYENTFEPYEFARGSILEKSDYKLKENL